MTEDERSAFLDEQMVMQCATVGPHGMPHMVPLWFVVEGDELIGWTYAKSQKARNLERDPRADRDRGRSAVPRSPRRHAGVRREPGA